MRENEKRFTMMHNYCAEALSVSHKELDAAIEDLLDPKKDVSPLLKYFNDLARHSNFRLPSKSLLEFDQKFFRKYVQRIRSAHDTVVKWVKKEVVDASRATLKTAFDQARVLL